MKLKIAISLVLLLFQFTPAQSTEVSGELKKWHKITLLFTGPQSSELEKDNPFFNYQLNVTFNHAQSGKSYVIPGYYAADGDAGNTQAESGNVWKAHFSPDETGNWTYKVSFMKGKWAALRDPEKLDTGGFMDGEKGSFQVIASDKSGRDFRAKGRLCYNGQRYLRFQETQEYFLKCGSDAPENFLAYEGFDGNFKNDGHKDDLIKTWEAHLKDWKEGDPTWSGGRGKEIIGAVNYLASKGLNSVSFLTMNIGGDDRNVFPYIDYNTWDRFDCSKLDQWEVIFEHADKIGLFLHFKTMEVENQGLLDNGGVGMYTKLYYRELIARFGHHLALNWNLCEETGDWVKKPATFPFYDAERLALANYVSGIDPYNHHLVIHNGTWYDGLYGSNSAFTGASLQTNKTDFSQVHPWTLKILRDSEATGKKWAVACDEPGDAQHSLIPDAEDPNHNDARKNGLWGAMMAGAWGTEWYFGYAHPHSDLTAQDYRSRDLFWDQGRICLSFFKDHNVKFWEMESNDELISTEGDYCLAKPGSSYVVFLKNGGESYLDVKNNTGEYSIKWYNPRKGGKLLNGKTKKIKGSGKLSLGLPPIEKNMDWVALIRKK